MAVIAIENIDIHYHEGKQVVFPAKHDVAVDAQGKLDVSLGQDDGWMWANKANTLVRIQLLLQK